MAEQDASNSDSRSNSSVIWDLANTFSDEAQSNARKKAVDSSFRLDRGEVPFDETLINLSLSRDVLLKAVEENAFAQLPLKLQRDLINNARNVSSQLSSIAGGVDSVVQFVAAVDELTTSIWYSNLQNMSGQILGFQEKLNQLKTLEKTLRELENRAKSFQAAEGRADESLKKLGESVKAAESTNAELKSFSENASKELEKLTQAQANALAAVASTQQNERNTSESAGTARAASGEISALKTQAATSVNELEQARTGYQSLVQELGTSRAQWDAALRANQASQKEAFDVEHSANQAERVRLTKLIEERETALGASITTTLSSAVTAFNTQSAAQLAASKSSFDTEAKRFLAETKNSLGELEDRSRSLVEKNEADVEARFKAILELEDVIREKIRLATNFQLFHSFQTRQLALADSVKFWQNALFITVGCSVGLSLIFVAWILLAAPTYNAAFFLKLSFTIPLVYAIHFCSSRFSEERRLEEEYAFKSNISISLEPYRELVEKLVKKDDEADATKYLDFVLASIDKVFTSPMQLTQKLVAKADTPTDVKEASQGLSKVIGSLSDLVQSLSKFK